MQQEFQSCYDGGVNLHHELREMERKRLVVDVGDKPKNATLDRICERFLVSLCDGLCANKRANFRSAFQTMRHSQRLHDYFLSFLVSRKPIENYLAVETLFSETFHEKTDEAKCRLLYAYGQVEILMLGSKKPVSSISRACVTAKLIEMEGPGGAFEKYPYPGVGPQHEGFQYTDEPPKEHLRSRARP